MFGRAFTSSELTIVVETDGELQLLGTYRVDPPSIRQAITILQAAQVEEGEEAIAQAVLEWLPLSLGSQLTRAFSSETVQNVALRLITAGFPDDMLTEHEDVRERAEGESWSVLTARYRHFFGGSMEDPWPLFVRHFREIDRINAEREISMVRAYGTARSGNKQAHDRMWERRGYDPAKLGESVSEMSDEQLRAESEKSLRALKKMHQRKSSQTNG